MKVLGLNYDTGEEACKEDPETPVPSLLLPCDLKVNRIPPLHAPITLGHTTGPGISGSETSAKSPASFFSAISEL